MRIAPVADLKKHLSRYLDQCESGPIVVTKNGRAVAVLVCVTNDDDVENIMLAHSPKLRKMLDEAEQRIREGGGVSHDDMRALVGQMP
jgi:prevent-host-death family protein